MRKEDLKKIVSAVRKNRWENGFVEALIDKDNNLINLTSRPTPCEIKYKSIPHGAVIVRFDANEKFISHADIEERVRWTRAEGYVH